MSVLPVAGRCPDRPCVISVCCIFDVLQFEQRSEVNLSKQYLNTSNALEKKNVNENI